MNIIKTTIAAALSIAALSAQAQHATTLTIGGDNIGTFTARNDGPADIVAVELLAGFRGRDGAVFGPGTAGDLSWAHWGGSDRYSVTTLSMDLQTSESEAFAVNLDGIWLQDTTYSASVYSPAGYIGARALVLWSDGFGAMIPMGRGMGGGTFSFTDVSPVPEPDASVLMLAGLLAVGFIGRKTGGAK